MGGGDGYVAGVSDCGWLPRAALLPRPRMCEGGAAYFEVSIVLGDDVLRARLVLAVPHVDVQLPLLQRQTRGAQEAAPHRPLTSTPRRLGSMGRRPSPAQGTQALQYHGYKSTRSRQAPIFQIAKKVLPPPTRRNSKNSGEKAGRGRREEELSRARKGARWEGRGWAQRLLGSTHVFNKELGQSVLLLDTFFQFSQEKTKRRGGRKGRRPPPSELYYLSMRRYMTLDSPPGLPYP